MQAYDPLDYGNLARSVVQALLGGPDEPLGPCVKCLKDLASMRSTITVISVDIHLL